jgi:hypothetical protein
LDHLDGGRNWAYALWTILMFEAWQRRWRSHLENFRTGVVNRPADTFDVRDRRVQRLTS